jgi:(1->4)-alpha-D-glucan 1-alpha-D-glucosylmutase
MGKDKVPVSTYRLQLHKGFTFDDAAAIAPYLYELGVSHVYCSPYLQAAPGSMHGYDVVDHQRVNEELGGESAHERFSRTLGENGLGQILDIVPNHMAIGSQNRFWWDVLENGAASRYASFFDIDWTPAEERLRDKVLVPVLADQYGRVLEAGGIVVSRRGAKFSVEAAGQMLPVAPTSLPAILDRAVEIAASDALRFISASLGRLPAPSFEDRKTVLERHRDTAVIERLLERLCAEEAKVCEALDRAVKELNADHDALDAFLNSQNYRLAYWKAADQQLGYRRFFDVNTLIGLRMERPHVFEETHALVLKWLVQGVLDGVRVDHPDGLRNPLEYFERLRAAAPGAWIVGEKILAAGEFLRQDWPIEGTSGYDFLNMALGLLVDPQGMAELRRTYGEFTGEPVAFPQMAHDKKIAVTQEALGSDVNRLASIFVDICENNRNQRDYTRAEIRRAIREIAACFAIYRTYVVPATGQIVDEDRECIARAIRCAKEKRTDIDGGLFDFFEEVLTLKAKGRLESEFVYRFQQFTSPVMAKGVEDTAFYCFNRLTALCEVGGDPERDGVSLEEFHSYQARMQATHPLTMTTLSTHDTKRSDDVRARLAVLSEIPREFGEAISRWTRRNDGRKRNGTPDRNTEYFLYQTLIGAWPIDSERTKQYMLKATREAKQRTSWTANDKEFEDGLLGFIDGILADKEFVADLERFVGRVMVAGRINSLAQTVAKYMVPGVPDLYQGSEIWDLSLVDPDNRRPVDYVVRRHMLWDLQDLGAKEIAGWLGRALDDGAPKIFVVHECLKLRRKHPEWFGRDAGYTAVQAKGEKARHVLAFLRGDRVLTVVPRLPLTLAAAWDGTTVEVPAGHWRNRFTGNIVEGGTVEVEALLGEFPVGVLVREEM